MDSVDNSSNKNEVRHPAGPGTGRIEGLDGLRAFAVISVLAFHLWPSSFPGGFLGVDVFFVISGFLITTLLLRERDAKGHITLRTFWKRRARRLIPALVLVVTTSVAVAWVVNDELLVNIRRQVLGALAFITNWVEIVAGTDYFADSGRSLFTPFWSLAVEEQFYLLWPMLLIGLLSLMASSTLRTVVALCTAALSALLMAELYDPQGSATRVYYGTDTHSFGLMIGVALAFAFSRSGRLLTSKWWQKLRFSLGIAALVALVILVVIVESDAPSTYRYGILLASVLSAVAVATLPGETTLFTRFCRVPALAWVGERSYGIYLWHWPVLLIISAAMEATLDRSGPGLGTAVIVICLTFLLSAASYRWVEDPIRRNGFRATLASVGEAFRPRRRILGWPGVASAGAGIILTAACVGFVTAPEKSQAQLSVESGERAIEAHNAQILPIPPAKEGVIDEGDAPPKVSLGSESIPNWSKDLQVPPGDQIVGIGDSVMSGAAPAIYERFPNIYINAKPILQWQDAPAIIRQMIDKGIMRRVVILNFGTNAGFKEPESEQALRDVLTMLGPTRRVVLVNTVGVSYWVPSTNARLLEISSEYPNTIVADWNSAVQKRPDLLHRDRTHPNDAGTAVYCDILATALTNLGPG